MARYRIHTAETAPAPAGAMLRDLQAAYGFLPNVFAVLAEAPGALGAFVEMNQRFAGTSLTPAERAVVQIATSVENRCGFCIAGHSASAKAAGLPAPYVAAIRNGHPVADARLEALRRFVVAVLAARGRLPAEDLQRFLVAGFTVAQSYEVILGICVKTFGNLVSNLHDIPLDSVFVPPAGSPAEESGETRHGQQGLCDVA